MSPVEIIAAFILFNLTISLHCFKGLLTHDYLSMK